MRQANHPGLDEFGIRLRPGTHMQMGDAVGAKNDFGTHFYARF
jgi:hypothetical protein